jgi:hypothetical protein
MQLKTYKVYVECGEYYGGSTNGAWTSSTDKQFYTTVNAQYPQMAVTIAEQQYGGPTRCRVTFISEA